MPFVQVLLHKSRVDEGISFEKMYGKGLKQPKALVVKNLDPKYFQIHSRIFNVKS